MSRVLVIGCGGVANVAIRKCCQQDEVFTELCIASRTKAKCDALAEAKNPDKDYHRAGGRGRRGTAEAADQ